MDIHKTYYKYSSVNFKFQQKMILLQYCIKITLHNIKQNVKYFTEGTHNCLQFSLKKLNNIVFDENLKIWQETFLNR